MGPTSRFFCIRKFPASRILAFGRLVLAFEVRKGCPRTPYHGPQGGRRRDKPPGTGRQKRSDADQSRRSHTFARSWPPEVYQEMALVRCWTSSPLRCLRCVWMMAPFFLSLLFSSLPALPIVVTICMIHYCNCSISHPLEFLKRTGRSAAWAT